MTERLAEALKELESYMERNPIGAVRDPREIVVYLENIKHHLESKKFDKNDIAHVMELKHEELASMLTKSILPGALGGMGGMPMGIQVIQVNRQEQHKCDYDVFKDCQHAVFEMLMQMNKGMILGYKIVAIQLDESEEVVFHFQNKPKRKKESDRDAD